MSVDSIGKLKGSIHYQDVAEFLTETFHCSVKSDVRHTEYEADLKQYVKKYYRKDYKITSDSGFLTLTFPDHHTRDLYYHLCSVNYHENIDYFSDLGLRDMVVAETTHISLGHDKEAENIISSVVQHFGGWYCPEDCEDNYQFFPSVNTEKEINTIVEAIFDKKQRLIGIRACAFNLKRGDFLPVHFDSESPIFYYAEPVTFMGNTETEILDEFYKWINTLVSSYYLSADDFRIWHDPFLFRFSDFNRVCTKYYKPVISEFWLRNIRTLAELACRKSGCGSYEQYLDTIPKDVDTLISFRNLVVRSYNCLLE